ISRRRCRTTPRRSTRATCRPCSCTWRPAASSRSTGRTRSPPARASPADRRLPREPQHAARLRGDDPRARDLPRRRGDLEGAGAAAHAAHVGHERDPRHRDRRRDADARAPAQGAVRVDRGPRRRRARVGERRRRLRRHRPHARDVQEARAVAQRVSTNLSNLLYLITIVTFVLALRFLSSPAHARRGNQIGAVGMLVAIVVTWIKTGGTSWWALTIGMLVGGGFGALAARRVKMTAMPQMVALFNGVGGGAAALISLAELHRILPEPGSPKVDISLAIVL